MRIANDMRSEMLATQAAESEIEKLRAMSWGHFVMLDSSFVLDPVTTSGLAELSGGRGEVRIAMLSDDASKKRLRVLSVRMTWNSRDGRTKEVALATLITPHGEDY